MSSKNRSANPDSRSAERIRRASLELFEEQTASTPVPKSHEKRAEARFSAYDLGQVRLVHGTTWSSDSPGIVVQVRDLSRHGLGVLHLNFVHVGTEMSVGLPTRSGGVEPVTAKVMRCVYLRKGLHEVGLKFDEPLDPGRFLVEAEKASADAEGVSGKVLWLCENRESRASARALMERVGADLVAAAEVDDAVERCRDVAIDAAVFDPGADLDGACAGLKALRDAGFGGAASAVLDVSFPEDEAKLLAAGFAGVSERPTTEAQMRDLLKDLLSGEGGGGGLLSTLWGDESLRPAVKEFVDSLSGRLDLIRMAASGSESAEVLQLAVDLTRSAASMGLAPLAEAGKRVVSLARGEDADLSGVTQEVDAIAALADSARAAIQSEGGA